MKGPEDSLLSAVMDLAKLLGWARAHFRPARTSKGWRTAVQGDGKGFPDLILVRKERLIAAELKSATGSLAIDQRMWLDAFALAGAETYLWRPKDFDEIRRVLA